ncbi:unnamed protein product [Ectocarpus sp. 6 AP-2014]
MGFFAGEEPYDFDQCFGIGDGGLISFAIYFEPGTTSFQ